jgi:metal-dependent amidase/aminoacylase/carboxypeptidase family protein
MTSAAALDDAKTRVAETVDRLADELERISHQHGRVHVFVTMAELFGKNLERIDFPVDPDDDEAGYGSTDCGNVSQALPTIHPYIRISPDGVPGHSREFAEWAKSPIARTGMVAAAKALAMTALDLVAQPGELQKAKEEFARR